MKYYCRIALLVGMALLLSPRPSEAGYAYFYVPSENTYYNVKVKSLLDKRFYRIIRQRYDYSCGSATLASLLTFFYDRPVDERTVIVSMYNKGDQAKIRKEGFSLLDMKKYLETQGLRANGYKESLDKLAKVGIPAIVLINRKGYMHFVLVSGVTRDKVLIGDPAQGKKIVNRKKFEAMWDNHILFVVEDDMRTARKTFNTNVAWHTRDLRDFTMPLPSTDLAHLTLFTTYTFNSFQ